MRIEYSKEAAALYVHFKKEYVAKSKEIEDDKDPDLLSNKQKNPL